MNTLLVISEKAAIENFSWILDTWNSMKHKRLIVGQHQFERMCVQERGKRRSVFKYYYVRVCSSCEILHISFACKS